LLNPDKAINNVLPFYDDKCDRLNKIPEVFF